MLKEAVKWPHIRYFMQLASVQLVYRTTCQFVESTRLQSRSETWSVTKMYSKMTDNWHMRISQEKTSEEWPTLVTLLLCVLPESSEGLSSTPTFKDVQRMILDLRNTQSVMTNLLVCRPNQKSAILPTSMVGNAPQWRAKIYQECLHNNNQE